MPADNSSSFLPEELVGEDSSMTRPHRHLEVDKVNDVFCARMRERRLDETGIHEFTEELLSLIEDQGCRKLVLSLGPGSPECLYSIFVAKLYSVRKRISELGGRMKLCDVTSEVVEGFEAVHIKAFFDFVPDREAAVAARTT